MATTLNKKEVELVIKALLSFENKVDQDISSTIRYDQEVTQELKKIQNQSRKLRIRLWTESHP